ncbi:hypothetical protein Mapa_011169 [Marchantia paleacea]|nr:hypothetical protein Mapa_011169 [Marchantia paleacea]
MKTIPSTATIRPMAMKLKTPTAISAAPISAISIPASSAIAASASALASSIPASISSPDEPTRLAQIFCMCTDNWLTIDLRHFCRSGLSNARAITAAVPFPSHQQTVKNLLP